MSLYLYPYNEKSIYTEWRRATQHARSRGGWRLHLADFADHLKVVHVVRVQDRCNTNTPGTKGHRKTQGQKAFLNANFPLVIPVIHKKSAAESMWTDVNRHCPVKDFFWFLPKVVGLIYLGEVAIYTWYIKYLVYTWYIPLSIGWAKTLYIYCYLSMVSCYVSQRSSI